MIDKVRQSFDDGVERIRWFSEVFSERLKVEVSVIKLMRQSADMEKRLQGLHQSIGERLHELRTSKVNPFEDRRIQDDLKEAEFLQSEIRGLKEKIALMGSPLE